MEAPRQGKKQWPENMIDTLTSEWRPIKRLRVLPLNPRVSSWNYDAKNCCRIYARMVKSRAISPRLVPLMRRWALLLLEYASCYNIGEGQGHVLTHKAQWAPNSLWLIPLLKEVVRHKSVFDCFSVSFSSFNVDTWESRTNGRCHILHKELKAGNLIRYRTTFQDGTSLVSDPIGSNTIRLIRRAVQTGLKRHRAPSVRRKLKRKIEENHERNKRYYASRDKLFG